MKCNLCGYDGPLLHTENSTACKRLQGQLIEFTTPTDAKLSVIVGRNGTFPITQLHVWESHDHVHVYLDGIGKRGIGISGGLRVTRECFANACGQFLAEYEKRERAAEPEKGES